MAVVVLEERVLLVRWERRALMAMVVLEERVLLVRWERRALMAMVVMEERVLLVRGEERERPMWALRVKGSELMEGRGHQRAAAQKEKARALAVIPVVVMPRERLSLRDRTLLR